MIEEDQRAYDIVKKLFKDDYGNPFEMTPGQISLFRAIYEKTHPRVQFDCYTQYGKSDIVSMAVLLRATTFPEKWPIIGATKDKAGIIIGKLIKHLFENDYTLSKFQIGADESMERIKRTRNRDTLTFRVDKSGAIGTVLAMSADARRKSQDAGDILIGHGAQNLIEDDAALIPDPIHGKAMRMLGGFKDNFLLKITNSFGRNHAYRSAIDSDNVIGTQAEKSPDNPLFHRIVIPYQQGIAEGRITEEFIQEMRASLDPVMFGILYECTYPPADMIEDGGWMILLTEEQIIQAQERGKTIMNKGTKRFALDVGEGTNFNASVLRTDNIAKVYSKTLEKDLMTTADTFAKTLTEERITGGNSFIDAVGIGSGVYARVKQMGIDVNAFKGGESPTEKSTTEKALDPIEFYNLRAECFWKMRTWIIEGGALEPHVDWKQLGTLRYRVTSDRKVQIMGKEEMRVRSLLQLSESTDIPDALSMTFAKTTTPFIMPAQSMPAQTGVFYPELGI
mgnify:FL=1